MAQQAGDVAVIGTHSSVYRARGKIVFLHAGPQKSSLARRVRTLPAPVTTGAPATAAGVCIVYGIATGGWGLLACGVIGGAVGGTLGAYGAGQLADEVYYSTSVSEKPRAGQAIIEIPVRQLRRTIPAKMCVP